MEATTVIAIAGIVGTLAGGFGGHYLQAQLKQKGERETKLTDTRTELYLEAMTYAAREEAWLDWIQTPYRSRADLPDVSRAELISAKMALFAPSAVQAEWELLLKVSSILSWNLQEDMPEVVFGEEALPDIPEAVAVRDAVRQLRDRLRQVMGTPDD